MAAHLRQSFTLCHVYSHGMNMQLKSPLPKVCSQQEQSVRFFNAYINTRVHVSHGILYGKQQQGQSLQKLDYILKHDVKIEFFLAPHYVLVDNELAKMPGLLNTKIPCQLVCKDQQVTTTTTTTTTTTRGGQFLLAPVQLTLLTNFLTSHFMGRDKIYKS